MSASHTKCLLLDMGKVLLDFDFKPFQEQLHALAGVEVETLREALTGQGLARAYEAGLISDGAFHDEVCKRINYRIEMDDFKQAWNSIFNPSTILPEELVQSLARRLNLWIVSNTNGIHFEYVRNHYPILRHFTGYVLSHEVGALKPDPKIFSCALSRADAKPEEAVFVDDQLPNVVAASELGIDAFQFVNCDQFAAELRHRTLL